MIQRLCSKCLKASKSGLMHDECRRALQNAEKINQEISKPPLYKHQQKTLEKLRSSYIVYDTSDAGTGKTRPALLAWWERRIQGGGRLLVVGVRTSLEAVWANQTRDWVPAAGIGIAWATDRMSPFHDPGYDIVAINTDGVNWIAEHKDDILLSTFDTIIVDEATYFKHRTSKRSRSLASFMPKFDFKELLTGTPNPNTVLDVWHQAYLLDNGTRLGKNFYQFRSMVCEQDTKIYGSKSFSTWRDKPEAMLAIARRLSDISIRHEFDKCVDIPKNVRRYIEYRPSSKLLKIYNKFKKDAQIMLEKGEVVGVNAASVMTKLLQLASGVVYTEGKNSEIVDPVRYEMIADLVQERESCVVFYMWTHQRDLILKYLEKNDVSVKALDGSTSDRERAEYVKAFQQGDVRVLVLHPETGSHALTLTKGTTCIWASPTFRADYLRQGIHRIYRSGQKKRTETIFVHTEGTIESQVYEKVLNKEDRMDTLLSLVSRG